MKTETKPFETVAWLIDAANAGGKRISDVALAQTAEDMEKTEQEVFHQMLESYQVMKEASELGTQEGVRSVSGLTGGMGRLARQYAESGKSITGGFMSELLYRALAVSEVNACMGRIVAAPTAGSCGIIPGCLIALQNHFDVPDEDIVMGLLNASAVGMVIARNATIAGAQGGCQAECGSAAAMAASAIVEIRGGSPDACGHAAAQALKSLMGLVCDPVAGLVEEPCVVRNATSASVAATSAEMALAGIESLIPIDEVISAMDAVGKSIPASLRETAEGGLAVTPTGKAIAERLMEELLGKK